MAIYDEIPRDSLRWLNNLSGKTNTALEASDQAAPEGWLPPGISSRLEAGKTYVMTLSGDYGTEIVGVTDSGLVRGLEGTTPKQWPAGSNIFQAITAGQIFYLMSRISEPDPDPEPGGTHTLTVGSYVGGVGTSYGFGDDGDEFVFGSLSPVETAGLGNVISLTWGWMSGDPDAGASLVVSDWTAGNVKITIGDVEMLFEYSPIDNSIFIDLTEQEYSLLPKSGTHPITIEVSPR